MTSRLVILRPEPGASTTADRARKQGWAATVIPLFEIAPLDWDPPGPDAFDAVLMTSANSARSGGIGLARYHYLPLYAVGAQTAEAAQAIGFETIIAGASDVEEMADRLRADGMRRIFHPAGEATRPFDETGLTVTRTPVYAAARVAPPDLTDAVGSGDILLVHSPRSGRYLDELCTAQAVARETLSLVAISEAALAAAGRSWRTAIAAERPTDDAMLAAASSLGGAGAIG
ncbi:uroporphyrinogen-III synthase [Parasphingopyxis algicola]|uniref:uroporphyrinogen-III synthase n=1 Tax=Parasphingopyxis algicola TaxID=2026624 RepID=UPI0015A1D922|nr:uroporphyrinogen-III synthase [Parasphingopyxis algicola]QLC25679.1 uroporphyrinogen-III synthase [Parasphingopyxis algicola]